MNENPGSKFIMITKKCIRYSSEKIKVKYRGKSGSITALHTVELRSHLRFPRIERSLRSLTKSSGSTLLITSVLTA